VTVDWSDVGDRGYMGSSQKKLRKPGEIVKACVQPKCKAHAKAYEKQKAASGQRNENSAEGQAERAKNEAAVTAENALRLGLVKGAIQKTAKLAGEVLRLVVLQALPRWMNAEDRERFPGIEKPLKSAKVDSAEFARAALALLFVGDKCGAHFVNSWSKPETGRPEFLKTLKVFGVDGAKAWAASPKKPAPKPTKKQKKAARGGK
jgi:hypothetical protein